MECKFCNAIKSKSQVIYEDESAVVIVLLHAVNFGHIKVLPKKHYTIMQDVPDNVLQHLFFLASKFTNYLYNIIKPEGTNILIQNGVEAGQSVAHFSIDIIPRYKEDSLEFSWNPMSVSTESLNSMQSLISDFLNKKDVKPKELKTESISKSNKLIKHLKYIP